MLHVFSPYSMVVQWCYRFNLCSASDSTEVGRTLCIISVKRNIIFTFKDDIVIHVHNIIMVHLTLIQSMNF